MPPCHCSSRGPPRLRAVGIVGARLFEFRDDYLREFLDGDLDRLLLYVGDQHGVRNAAGHAFVAQGLVPARLHRKGLALGAVRDGSRLVGSMIHGRTVYPVPGKGNYGRNCCVMDVISPFVMTIHQGA